MAESISYTYKRLYTFMIYL